MPVHLSNTVPDDDTLREWWYNSLDCCVTDEVYDKIIGHAESEAIYGFERSLQGPALDMMLRGFKIDPIWRSRKHHGARGAQGHPRRPTQPAGSSVRRRFRPEPTKPEAAPGVLL